MTWLRTGSNSELDYKISGNRNISMLECRDTPEQGCLSIYLKHRATYKCHYSPIWRQNHRRCRLTQFSIVALTPALSLMRKPTLSWWTSYLRLVVQGAPLHKVTRTCALAQDKDTGKVVQCIPAGVIYTVSVVSLNYSPPDLEHFTDQCPLAMNREKEDVPYLKRKRSQYDWNDVSTPSFIFQIVYLPSHEGTARS